MSDNIFKNFIQNGFSLAGFTNFQHKMEMKYYQEILLERKKMGPVIQKALSGKWPIQSTSQCKIDVAKSHF